MLSFVRTKRSLLVICGELWGSEEERRSSDSEAVSDRRNRGELKGGADFR